MSQRTFHLTGTVTDFSGSPVVGAPCSFQPLFPGGLLGAIDGNGAVVEAAPISFTTDVGGSLVLLDGTSPVLIDYPGDYQSAYQATQVQATLNGQAYISPVNFAYASSIAVSSWISAPITTGLVTMRFVYTGDDNMPIVGGLISITLIAPALVVATGQQLSATVPSQGLTDSSGTAYIALNPNSLLNPNNLGYGITASTPDGGTEIIPWISVVPAVVDTYLGAWNSGTAYVAASGSNNGNVVISGGVLYRCILGHTNHVPPNATYWVVVSGLPTDLLSAHATFSAQVGQIALTSTGIGHSAGLVPLADDANQSPVSLADDIAILAARCPGNRRTITTSAAISNTADDTVLCNAAGGAIAPTLAVASGRARKLYFIATSAAHATTLTVHAGDTVVGGTTSTTVVLSALGQWAVLESDGANTWYAQTGTGASITPDAINAAGRLYAAANFR